MDTYHILRFRMRLTLLILIAFFSFSCSKDSLNEPVAPVVDQIVFDPQNEGGLVNYEKVGTYNVSTIQSYVILGKALGLQLDPTVVKYDIELYKLEYKINYKGKLLTASGLLALPMLNASQTIPAYSFQHGTILLKSEAPSLDLKNVLLPIELFLPASMGMMAVLPDYVGFGSSSAEFHPYYVKEPSAMSVIDLLNAAKNFSTQKKYSISDKVNLVGYSQGGYTTLATHQILSSNPAISYFKNFTSYAGAGGYDLPNLQSIILKRDTYEQPYYLGYILKAYQTYYGFSQPSWTDLLKSPYAQKMNTLVDGSKSGDEVNAALTNNVKDLFVGEFISNSNSNTFSNLNQRLNENSLLDVTTSKPLFLYHGKQDIWVFPETSKSTYDKLVAKGTKNIAYIELEGTHSTAFVPFANDVFSKLVESLK